MTTNDFAIYSDIAVHASFAFACVYVFHKSLSKVKDLQLGPQSLEVAGLEAVLWVSMVFCFGGLVANAIVILDRVLLLAAMQ